MPHDPQSVDRVSARLLAVVLGVGGALLLFDQLGGDIVQGWMREYDQGRSGSGKLRSDQGRAFYRMLALGLMVAVPSALAATGRGARVAMRSTGRRRAVALTCALLAPTSLLVFWRWGLFTLLWGAL